MSRIDGRRIGGTGEYRGDHTPDDDVPRRQTPVDGQVRTVDCVEQQGGDGWECRINGEGAGYRNQPIQYDELEISGAEIDKRTTPDGRSRTRFTFPTGQNCVTDATRYQNVDQDRKLVCPA